ncbi:MAG: bifunctional diaminohydroxyphosphoribosylaminopyrimidine deaminase/5-amino-6-(5-phosphoribosylamino)uracil reductase RibD [Planctomycetes bacterium]|nr:bifunctional diaminohydroxyphosphoribosylaminopyrimidine deaminase/5-amino-6-(5-phosphoribosylamino)uracil reductase RibD [Planctomycetota bacterium]
MSYRAPSPAERAWLARSVELARLGRGAVEPNPRVGAVLLAGDQWVADGAHLAFGGPHAEIEALIASKGAPLRPDTLVVSLEPCSATAGKKTPPCTTAIVEAGIRRVVVGALDPDPRHRGAGLALLAAAGVEVALDPEGGASFARENAPFLRQLERELPHVVLKWAMTLDGRIATASGSSRWITGEAARADVHERRAYADAVLTGVGTLLVDDCRLDARLARPLPRTPPWRIVLDADLRTPPTAAFAQLADGRAAIYAASDAAPARVAALRACGVDVRHVARAASHGVDLPSVLRDLHRRGVRRLWVEAGPRLAGAFFDAGLVDRVCAYVAPRLLGAADAPGPLEGAPRLRMDEALALEELGIERFGEDLRIEGAVRRAVCAAHEVRA